MATPTSNRRNVTTIVLAPLAALSGQVPKLTSRELVTMREEITHADQVSTPAGIANAIHTVLRHVAETSQSSRSLPVLGGTYWPNVSLPAGTAKPFAHGVDGIVAFIACRVRTTGAGPAPVITEVGQDNNGRITLAATVACIADLWFYPQPGPGGIAVGSAPPFPTPTSGALTWHSQTFTSNGTWTAPITGLVWGDGWGGGGGGGSGSGGTGASAGVGGGGGGGAIERWIAFSATATTSYNVTIGAGGSGGAGVAANSAGIQGSPGGDTAIDTGGPQIVHWRGAQGGFGGINGDSVGTIPGGPSDSGCSILSAGSVVYLPPAYGGSTGHNGQASDNTNGGGHAGGTRSGVTFNNAGGGGGGPGGVGGNANGAAAATNSGGGGGGSDGGGVSSASFSASAGGSGQLTLWWLQ